MELHLKTLQPNLRYIHYIELIPEFTTHLQIAYDHRFFFCVKGNYEITVKNQVYLMKENTVLFVPSGTSYHLHRPKENVLLAGINFDFSSDFSDMSVPIVPAFKKENYIAENKLEDYNFSDAQYLNRPFFIENQNYLFSLIKEMMDEYTTKYLFYQEKNNALLKQMITSVARTLATGISSVPANTVETVISYIQEHYNEHISNETIGKALSFHPNYLNRLILMHTGKTLHQYVLSVRLTKALEMLQSSSLSITQIALKTGFCDLQQFSKFFQSQIGCSPSSFR